ncbi:hypothetical protein HPB58_20665 [Priestia filamentosa]|jgi:hypothetical protein|uniref:Uncharacterized protein n=1 Tax=Priestia endophytica DSM 13796 TaxID=1121089 RepID=A0A1I5XUE7_9BACI|nr:MULTISPECIES: hypothetical protein [Priestia]KAB2496217.1 hypothetical protein F8155_01210 [Priestia endophytica]KYG31404.1 hypothetical protein AZF06_06580 [Priestia endophytica]MBG9811728.1 hypothetical protein [Priestia endophytica]MCM3536836.1 hypothetical protein [Priestia endophytica]MED3726880.1 hypothetical protein [Priestia filamentosa]
MAKRTKKHDADQKNKKGFDSSKTDTEFSREMGSAKANHKHKEDMKKQNASKNAGVYKGGL